MPSHGQASKGNLQVRHLLTVSANYKLFIRRGAKRLEYQPVSFQHLLGALVTSSERQIPTPAADTWETDLESSGGTFIIQPWLRDDQRASV